MDLRYDAIAASMAGENRHPQTVMRDLGISYTSAVPQSLADQWWFVNCTGVPDDLPGFLSVMCAEEILKLGPPLPSSEDFKRLFDRLKFRPKGQCACWLAGGILMTCDGSGMIMLPESGDMRAWRPCPGCAACKPPCEVDFLPVTPRNSTYPFSKEMA